MFNRFLGQKEQRKQHTRAQTKPSGAQNDLRNGLATASDLLNLQHTAGNRAVSELVHPSSSDQLSPAASRAIQQSRGAGTALPPNLRLEMEQSLHAGFGGVRIHTDRQADHLNRELGARAFTTGQDVYFRQGQFAPSTQSGQRTLRHELTHVVQQGGRISSNLRLGPENDRHEQEADQIAHQGTQSTPRSAAPAGAIQRWKWPWERDRVKKLGGSANTVYRVQHGRKGPVGYMKPNSAKDPGMGARSVLSSQIDQTLGLNRLARETYTSINGQEGSESAEVPGTPLYENQFETEITDPIALDEIAQYGTLPSQKEVQVKQGFFGKKKTKYMQYTGSKFNTHDFSHPETQSSLSDIQLQDAITGQYDRHGGNIRIDPRTHRAMGYDSDLMDIKNKTNVTDTPDLHYDKRGPVTDEMRAKKDIARQKAEAEVNKPVDKGLGLPTHLNRSSAEKLRDTKARDFEAQLQARDPANWERLDPQLRRELIERYKVTRRYAKRGLAGGPNGPRIIDAGGWNQQTYDEQMSHPEVEDYRHRKFWKTYLQRSVKDYNDVANAPGGRTDEGHRLDAPGSPALRDLHVGPKPTIPAPRPPVVAPTVPAVTGRVRPVPPPKPPHLMQENRGVPPAYWNKPLPQIPVHKREEEVAL